MGSCMSTGQPNVDHLKHQLPILESRLKPRVKRTQSLKKTEHIFRKSKPEFDKTRFLDHLRKREYASLDAGGHIYLDYTGAGLYAASQLRSHDALLQKNVFGNPHSTNPTSAAITALDKRAREAVLKFFNASGEEYAVVFTANATHALKLVGESYPFASGGEFLVLCDNHNSVIGIREFARAKGAKITSCPVTVPELRVDTNALHDALKTKGGPPGLFAYPAQSNFSGVQHSLEWIETAQAHGWDVLLDAAAYVPTNSLDLSRWHPDFVSISFYKMFGYPAGVGCLIARKSALFRLNRPWFAGGTIFASSMLADDHILLDNHEAFEDGTINYLNLPAVHIGLDHLTSIGMHNIHQRVASLTDWLLKELLSLRHINGKPAVKVYGPHDWVRRGGTITFNFLDPAGDVVDERVVERRSTLRYISLRTGCFCNPGAGEAAFQLSQDTLLTAFSLSSETRIQSSQEGTEKRLTFDNLLNMMGMPTGGAVRISLGLVSNFADVYRFMDFARTFVDDVPVEDNLLPRGRC